MTKNMDVYDYSVLLEELKPQIIEKNLEKIYQPQKNLFLLKLGKKKLVVKIPYCIFLSDKINPGKHPLDFAMFLRKKLLNAKLKDVFLVNNDRIIKMVFTVRKEQKEKTKGNFKEEQLNLILEMFGKGNVIFTDKNNIILNILNRKRFKERTLLSGEKYIPPKKTKIESPITVEAVMKLLDDRYVISCLSPLPFGVKYLNLILEHAGVAADTPGKAVTENEIVRILNVIEKIRSRKKFVLVEDNFYAADLFVKGGFNVKKFDSFNELLEYYYLEIEDIRTSNKVFSREKKRIKKLKRKLDAQKKHLTLLLEKEEIYKRKIEFLEGNIPTIEEIISLYNTDKDELKKRRNVRLKRGRIILMML